MIVFGNGNFPVVKAVLETCRMVDAPIQVYEGGFVEWKLKKAEHLAKEALKEKTATPEFE